VQKQRQDGSRTPHFQDAQWVDYVRGLAGESLQQEIQNHLNSGCEDCKQTWAWMLSVAETGASDAQLKIPDEVVSRAKAIFRPAETGWIEKLRSLAAELVTQVPLDFQPAGVRSLGTMESKSGDRFLYRAGKYAVDLKVELPGASESGEIIGQIANEQDAADNLSGVLVQIVVPFKQTLGKTIGETETNRFGEFLMEYPSAKSAILRFALKQRGERIDLPLRLKN
jgi:hypothetical protein